MKCVATDLGVVREHAGSGERSGIIEFAKKSVNAEERSVEIAILWNMASTRAASAIISAMSSGESG